MRKPPWNGRHRHDAPLDAGRCRHDTAMVALGYGISAAHIWQKQYLWELFFGRTPQRHARHLDLGGTDFFRRHIIHVAVR